MMRKNSSIAMAVVAFVALIATACGGNDYNSIPLPHAFPRSYVYTDSLKTIVFNGIPLDVNADALIDTVDNGLTISYPRYDALVYVGLKRNIDNYAAEVSNRAERFSMNLGVAESSATYCDYSSASDVVTTVVRANTVVQTPVQVMVQKPSGNVLMSCVAFMGGWNENVPYDSVKPIIDVLERDLSHIADKWK